MKSSFLKSTLSLLATVAFSSVDIAAADQPIQLAFVAIEATGALTSEPIPTALVKPGFFTVRRRDSLEHPLTVYLAYGGTASRSDYEPLPEKVVVPAGTTDAEILVLARADDLVEGTETLVARIVPPPTSPETRPYDISPFASSAEIRIADEDKGEGLPIVGIKTVRGETIEPSPLSRVAPGEFVIYREGSTREQLEVYLATGGTATPGADYSEIDKLVRFGAGEAEVKILIAAHDDSLVEGDETVVLEITIPPTDGPPTYTISPSSGAARLAIHDNDREGQARIEITSPRHGSEIPPGVDIEVNAVAIDAEGYMPILEFYLDGSLLDTSVITFVRAPDPGTPIHHSVLWKSPTPGKHELVARGKDSRGVIVSSEPIVVLVGSGSERALVSIEATDQEGTELPPTFSSIDALEYKITRTGSTENALTVFFSLHGTASREDYFEVPGSIVIPAGNPSATFQVVPKADVLTVVEPMETVGVRLEPSPMATPLSSYGIDRENAFAAGVIHEQRPPEGFAVELALPDADEAYETRYPIHLVAVSYAPEGWVMVEFYDGERRIGSALAVVDASLVKAPPVATHAFTWMSPTAGEHVLTARITLTDGEQVISKPITILVKGVEATEAYIKITEPIEGQQFRAGASIPITAVAVDPEGYIARVEFYANDRQIGVSELVFVHAPDPGTPMTHTFNWENVPSGEYALTARALDTHRRPVASFPVKILVGSDGGKEAMIEISSPRSGEMFEAAADIPISAVAIDPNGYIPRVEFYANERLIGVSEIVFIRAPDPGTPITHTTVWESVPAGEYTLTARAIDSEGEPVVSARVSILVGDGGGAGQQVVLVVEARDQLAAETSESGAPDKGVFIIRRVGGSKEVEVAVQFKLGGTAVNGVDYLELKEPVIIPAGVEAVELIVEPIPDKALEREEVLELTLVEPVCPAIFPPPPQCYRIGKLGGARVIIQDHAAPVLEALPKVAIVPPSEGADPARGQSLEIRTDAAAIGKACTLETSTDLRTWTPVSPVYLPEGQLTYVTETGTEKQRYYRLRVQ